MKEKTGSSEKALTQLDVPPISEKCSNIEEINETNSKPHQHAKIRRTVKLPRLKLADLVAQVTEENAQSEISTGSAVGNEIW